MKKVFSLAVIALFSVSFLFTACGDGAAPAEETTTEEQTMEAPATEEATMEEMPAEEMPAADTTAAPAE